MKWRPGSGRVTGIRARRAGFITSNKAISCEDHAGGTDIMIMIMSAG